MPPQYGQPTAGYPQQPGYGQQPPYPPPGYQYPQQGGPYNPYVPYGGAAGFVPGRLAPWGARVGATLLDAVMTLPFVIVALIVVAATASSGTYDPNTGLTVGGGVPGASLAVALLLYFGSFAFGLYQLYRQGTTGQTLGKKIVGIRVIREADGQYTGFGMAFVRGLAHFFDGLACYIGFLWPLWDAKKQTFADKMCSTVVVVG